MSWPRAVRGSGPTKSIVSVWPLLTVGIGLKNPAGRAFIGLLLTGWTRIDRIMRIPSHFWPVRLQLIGGEQMFSRGRDGRSEECHAPRTGAEHEGRGHSARGHRSCHVVAAVRHEDCTSAVLVLPATRRNRRRLNRLGGFPRVVIVRVHGHDCVSEGPSSLPVAAKACLARAVWTARRCSEPSS